MAKSMRGAEDPDTTAPVTAGPQPEDELVAEENRELESDEPAADEADEAPSAPEENLWVKYTGPADERVIEPSDWQGHNLEFMRDNVEGEEGGVAQFPPRLVWNAENGKVLPRSRFDFLTDEEFNTHILGDRAFELVDGDA